jgi:hypothetical protein
MRTDCFGDRPDMSTPATAEVGGAPGLAPVAPGGVELVGLSEQKATALVAGSRQSQERHHECDLAAGRGSEKAFHTLRAVLALNDYSLSRTHGDDGPVSFHIDRWGLVQAFRVLEAVRAFAQQVGASNA